MEQVRYLTQAYAQAPWRRQLQVIGTFLLAVVAIALVAGIYLNVTSRAGTLGRQIQEMQIRMGGLQRVDVLDASATAAAAGVSPVFPIEELRIQIADLEAELAHLSSTDIMIERAQDLGFEPVEADELQFLVVPGYAGRQTAQLAPAPTAERAAAGGYAIAPTLPSVYRESLGEWFAKQVKIAARLVGGDSGAGGGRP